MEDKKRRGMTMNCTFTMIMRYPLLTSVVTLALRSASTAAFAPHSTQSSTMGPHRSASTFSTATSSATSLQISALESLADVTTLSIDSGDIDTVSRYAKTGLITDATTNPLFVSQVNNLSVSYIFFYMCISSVLLLMQQRIPFSSPR